MFPIREKSCKGRISDIKIPVRKNSIDNPNPLHHEKITFSLSAALMFCISVRQASAQSYASVTLTGDIQSLTVPSTSGSYVIIPAPGSNGYLIRGKISIRVSDWAPSYRNTDTSISDILVNHILK